MYFQVEEVESGRLKVNGKSTSLDYIIKEGDLLEHYTHR